MRRSSRAKFFPRVVATVGFIGYSPVAPGTMGSLAAALVFLLFPPYLSAWSFLIGLAVLFIIAVWSAQQIVDARDDKATYDAPGKVDPQEVVIDEVMGMAVTMAFISLTAKTIGIGFLLFRIFDIVKPFPARRSEKLPGGWGIVMDDVVAGIYANVGLRIILSF